MEDSEIVKCCVICEGFEEKNLLICVTSKGLKTLKESAVLRLPNSKFKNFVEHFYVHEECRKKYVSKRNIDYATKQVLSNNCANDKETRQIGMRNNLHIFNTACIFCEIIPKPNDKENIYYVQTLHFEQTIVKKCNSRNDSWANEVLADVMAIGGLFTHKTCYHISCYQRFVNGKNKPSAIDPNSAIPSNLNDFKQRGVKRKSEQHVPGQTTDNERNLAFLQAVKYLEEKDEELFTIKDFSKLMGSYGCEPYSTKRIKSKLLDHFGCDVTFFSRNGIDVLICLPASAERIVHEFHSKTEKKRLDSAEEKKTTNYC